MQTTLNLFPKTALVEINESLTIDGYPVYIRRTDNETFFTITGLNLLGKPLGVLFQFTSFEITNVYGKFPNKKIIPELNELSYSELITFIKEVIIMHKKRLYVWDYKYRCNVYAGVNEVIHD